MNSRKEVRNNKNVIIGYCNDYGDKIDAIGFRKGYLGFYNKNTNITFDKTGRIYCYGDATAELVRNAENDN